MPASYTTRHLFEIRISLSILEGLSRISQPNGEGWTFRIGTLWRDLPGSILLLIHQMRFLVGVVKLNYLTKLTFGSVVRIPLNSNWWVVFKHNREFVIKVIRPFRKNLYSALEYFQYNPWSPCEVFKRCPLPPRLLCVAHSRLELVCWSCIIALRLYMGAQFKKRLTEYGESLRILAFSRHNTNAQCCVNEISSNHRLPHVGLSNTDRIRNIRGQNTKVLVTWPLKVKQLSVTPDYHIL